MIGNRSRNRGYIAIRREPGKPDVPTDFAADISVVAMIQWCQSDGYTVLGYEFIPMPDNTKHLAKVIITVQQRAGR